MTTDNTDIPVKEIEVPVPWGHISGKLWGEDGVAVVMVHGFNDNCCSFDRLIPLLPSVGFRYLTVDLPGNGKSSKISQGLSLGFFDYVFCLDLFIDYFDLKTFDLIGHSLGGQLCLFYSALFPEKVTKTVCLDGILYKSLTPNETLRQMRKRFDDTKRVIKANNKKHKYFSYDDIVEFCSTKRSMSTESMKVLVDRSLTQSAEGYRLVNDPRFRVSFSPLMDTKLLFSVFLNVKCPVLVVFSESLIQRFSHKGMDEIMCNVIRAGMKMVVVEGRHHVHLEHPQRIADIINPFLFNEKSRL